MTSKIQEWAARQLADYDARQPGTLFAEGITLNIADAYQLQSEVARLRCVRGERVIGYKVGCTSASIRAQLGIDHCVTGRLYDSERHESGTQLSLREFAHLAIEGELAVELAKEPNERELECTGIPECVKRVLPVIELHHYLMRGSKPSAGELIANNAIHAGFVAGPGVHRDEFRDETSIASAALSILVDGRQLEQGAGSLLIQTIRESLKWLTTEMRRRGDRLEGGQIILTGSIPGLIPVTDHCQITVQAPPFGNVEAAFHA